MNTERHHDAWGDYVQALTSVFPGVEGDLRRLAYVSETHEGEPSDEAIEELITCSDALASALADNLQDDPDVRDTAALRLSAAAAVDIDIANHLAALDPETVEITDDALRTFRDLAVGEPWLNWNELDRIDRILASDDPWADGGGDVTAHGMPRQAPQADVADAVNRVLDYASSASTKAVAGLIGVSDLPMVHRLGQYADKNLPDVFRDILNQGGRLVRKAAELLQRAVNKLVSVLGARVKTLRVVAAGLSTRRSTSLQIGSPRIG